MHTTKEAMDFLNKTLNLPATGQEQDWDIELSDPNRADEFVSYLENNKLTQDHKFALMALILGSIEDLSHNREIPTGLWERVSRIIRSDMPLYTDLLRYWTPEGNDADDFAISPLLRRLE